MSEPATRLPRPWFITLTLPWYRLVGFDDLKTALQSLRLSELLPAHQVMVPETRWHSTLFVLARANGTVDSESADGQSAEEQMLGWLSELAAHPRLLPAIRAAFSAIEIEAHELKCFDGATTVQFRGHGDGVSRLRAELARVCAAPMGESVERWNSTTAAQRWAEKHGTRLVKSALDDGAKSIGDKLFGSVARSLHANEVLALRWSKSFGPVALKVEGALLTVSDEALCNPLALERAIDITPA